MRRLWVGVVLAVIAGVGAHLLRAPADLAVKAAGTPPVLIPIDVVAVRILLGRGDTEPRAWDGSLTVSNGTLIKLEGWRFREGDKLTGAAAWTASSHYAPRRPGQQRRPNGAAPQRQVLAAGIVATIRLTPQTQIHVATPQGGFDFGPGQVSMERPAAYLNGSAVVEGVLPEFPVTAAPTEDDFPAAAAAPDGRIWVAYVAYTNGTGDNPHLGNMRQEPDSFEFLRPRGNGDQVHLACLAPGANQAAWSEVTTLTPSRQDVLGPASGIL